MTTTDKDLCFYRILRHRAVDLYIPRIFYAFSMYVRLFDHFSSADGQPRLGLV
jgi:hypothetical protein